MSGEDRAWEQLCSHPEDHAASMALLWSLVEARGWLLWSTVEAMSRYSRATTRGLVSLLEASGLVTTDAKWVRLAQQRRDERARRVA